MRHRRRYADVKIWRRKSTVGFLGTPYAFGLSPENLGRGVLFCVATIMMAFSMY